MSSKHFDSLSSEEPSLPEVLQRLAEELTQCTETLRKTHELVSPQLETLEKRFPDFAGGQSENENPLLKRDSLRFP
jgi:hypothetical protein